MLSPLHPMRVDTPLSLHQLALIRVEKAQVVESTAGFDSLNALEHAGVSNSPRASVCVWHESLPQHPVFRL